MTTFDERKRDAEKRYEHDEELRFKANARRNKLLGLWAAEKMGLDASEVEAYAKEVVLSDFEKPGDDDVLEKVVADFTAKGLGIGADAVRAEMDRLMAVARDQIMNE